MGRLDLIDEGFGSMRHWLDGEPVHCGEALELLAGGRWVPCRYERTGPPDDPIPLAYLDDARVVALGPDDVLRWPAR